MGEENQISFTEESTATQFTSQAKKRSFFMRMAYASGLAKTDDEATYVLLGAAVVIALVAVGVFLFASSGGSHLPPETPDSPTWPKSVTPAP